jgi:hypothetical protein
MVKDAIVEFVNHPVTVLVGVFSGLATVWEPATALAVVLWSQIGTIFSALSISAATLAPELPQLPEGSLQMAAMIAGALYVAKLLDKTADAYFDRL